MKKFFWLILLIIVLVLVFWALLKKVPKSGPQETVPVASTSEPMSATYNYQPEPAPVPVPEKLAAFAPPLARAKERITKKPFGIYITRQNSPVQPERFAGYHTGADFEIFPEELTVDVAVKAVCSGKLLVERSASGYGGVVVQSCSLDGSPITIVYGHLDLASVKVSVGQELQIGDFLGNLGADKSAQTDGERKHLHLGFHKGSVVNILGYVPNKAQLSGWLDPCQYVCGS